jgi:hypothetical protein
MYAARQILFGKPNRGDIQYIQYIYTYNLNRNQQLSFYSPEFCCLGLRLYVYIHCMYCMSVLNIYTQQDAFYKDQIEGDKLGREHAREIREMHTEFSAST